MLGWLCCLFGTDSVRFFHSLSPCQSELFQYLLIVVTHVKPELLIGSRTTRLFYISTDNAIEVVPQCLNLNEAVFALINSALILVLKESLTGREISLTKRTLESVASHRSEDEMIESEMLLTFINDSMESSLHFIAHSDIVLIFYGGVVVKQLLHLHCKIQTCYPVKCFEFVQLNTPVFSFRS